MHTTEGWIAAWGNAISIRPRRPENYGRNLTLRYPVTMMFDGTALRVTLDNFCGTQPVTVSRVYAAKSAEKADIIGKSRFRMASTRTTAAIPTQEAATIEKGIELSEEEATFDDGKTGNASRPAQVPEEKLDETFTSIPPEELGYGDDEPEEDASDTPRASGSSFDEIDDACKTAKNPDATQAQREKAAKVFTDMEGTELYEKMMEGSSEIGIRIKGLIEIRLKKPEKEFVVPDNIEDFDIRNYV